MLATYHNVGMMDWAVLFWKWLIASHIQRLLLLDLDGLTCAAGEPLNAPVASSGTFVMNNEQQLSQAMADYQRGEFGLPWEPELPDDEWAELCESRWRV